MNIEELKEKLLRFGVDFTLLNNKICVPCPFSDHENLKPGLRANILLGIHTDFGECNFCGKKTNSTELLAAFEENYKTQQSSKIESKHERSVKVWSVDEIMSYEFGEDEWLVRDIISLPAVAALSGMPGDYKTWLTIHIALSIARGVAVFGNFECKQGGVLIIDEENHLKHIKKRLALLGVSANDPISYLSMSGFKADRPEKMQQIVKIIQEKEIKLVVIDSLIRVHDRDENDASQMSKVFNGLQEITKSGASILFTHHHRKQTDYRPTNPAQSLRGSSDISAALDSHISVERKKDDDILVVRQPKSRQSEPCKPFEIRIIRNQEGNPTGFEYVGPHNEAKKKAEEAADAAETLVADGAIKGGKEIEETLAASFGKTAIKDGLKIAQDERHTIERVPKEELPEEFDTKGGKHYYRAVKAQVNDFVTFPSL